MKRVILPNEAKQAAKHKGLRDAVEGSQKFASGTNIDDAGGFLGLPSVLANELIAAMREQDEELDQLQAGGEA